MTAAKVTSADVARLAGVSQSAVSRVFTPGASASKKTVDKVRAAAESLGYRPNSLARAMVSGRSRIIGLVVAYLENHFYPEAIEKLSNALQERGYHVLMFMAPNTATSIDNVIEEILDYQVDGIIAASVAMSSELSDRCRAAGVPMVLFNRSQDDPGMSAVTSDNYAGGRKVADFLLATGHRKIGYIAGWEGASTQRDRETGFCERLAEDGLTLHARGVGNFKMETAAEATRQMFAHDRPDAVFVGNDHMAFAVMDVLRSELGLSVPGDVSVVGYDDVPTAAWPAYDMTTVRQPANRMVSATVDILLDEIEGSSTGPRRIAIDGPLIVRGSARIPKGWKNEGF
ncbi:LacI family DNA-binding transcriptional regulator [Phaeobacter gallaeciensis]|uniref:Transcriptional regulator, lacI family n=1 Tax=Phaeobacter gallaeciensis TaxID=60890 RepID=A0AAC9Z7A6_9RHOB|nr:LacI family DNA-binding transcriptional regulator [Phaeobacter gallaeciensis]AHD08471.1 transcriptional regulator, LacI family [Phaeobacter gallaeciensis DSM 26640]ATE91737.1 transcriptional regulator, lacI family [Phaeobacter gallaeciensis]ATE98439.1 transcriptional regulator, lacI family [Phaeobacter gallaeciensis]ATF00353.1 transcriptional regulator, lacI family [Phaeobacter gallaeciensis]ATF04785.1 transcriptional regulator, lacI family [Phaeobacter gallaeciensis]